MDFYVGAERFVEECLRREGSLFTPGHAIWSERWISELYERFVGSPDESKGVDFTTKLLGQLSGAPADVFQLAAEMYYVLLAPQYTDGAGKRAAVEAVLNASPEPVAIPADLLLGLEVGIASYGAALTRRFDQYVFLCEFARAWVSLPPADREALLGEPFEFQSFAVQVPHKGAQAQVEALIHMVFPDAFETTVSLDQKKKIAAALAEYVGDQTAPLDRQLQEIRAALTPELGENFSFYDEPLVSRWLIAKPAPPESPAGEAEEADDIHLIVKWSPRFEPQTDERHIEVARERGVVWWGMFSSTGGPKVAEERVEQLRSQLEADRETFVFIVGQFGTARCWRTRLLDVSYDRPESEEDLIPSYYHDDWSFHLWVKVTDFEEIERDELYRLLDPATKTGRPIALSNQTNPLFARIRTTPRFWWVNQGDSYRRARAGAYLWAPILDRAGRTKSHWLTMGHLRPGDFVFSYANSQVRALNVVRSAAVPAPRPDPQADQGWSEEGNRAELHWEDLEPPILLRDIPVEWRTRERGPFAGDGSVNQGYLFPLSDEFVARMVEQFPQISVDVSAPRPSPLPIAEQDYVEPPLPDIAAALDGAGMTIDERTLRRYHLSLKTRGFVVLSGISGTGKTWLAEEYARAVGARPLVVPVAPNWTTNEDLLGYLNPLTQQYHDTEFSRFLRDAASASASATTAGQTPRPFHLILDEMNLARVEYYFAKFLSAMELRARSEDASIELAPNDQVPLPPNLKFIGTVNVDETTHGFADKVYDRSQLLELTIDEDEVAHHLGNSEFAPAVVAAWKAMREVAPFAFRVLDEITAYVAEAAQEGVAWEEALDEQLLQKVLPKVRGTDLRVGGALRDFVELSANQFPLSYEKATVMLRAFNEHGYTSYF